MKNSEELLLLRKSVQDLFEPIWEKGDIEKFEAHLWLADRMALPISECLVEMFDKAECEQALKILEAYHSRKKG